MRNFGRFFNFNRFQCAVLLVAAVVAIGVLNSPKANAAVACASLFSSTASSSSRIAKVKFESRIAAVDGRSIYYEHLRAKPGKRTALLFFGMHTPTAMFNTFKEKFAERANGEGLILFAYSTMLESLMASQRLHPSTYADAVEIELSDLVRQATAVVNAAQVKGPVVALGYSFGSAPAAAFASFHRSRVESLVLISPLVFTGDHSLEYYAHRSSVEALATLNPVLGSRILEQQRAGDARTMAKRVVDGYLATMTEELATFREPMLKGLVSLIRSVDTYDLRRENFELWPQTHFILGKGEYELRLRGQKEAVRKMTELADLGKVPKPEVEIVEDGDHYLLQALPQQALPQQELSKPGALDRVTDSVIAILRKPPATGSMVKPFN